jgi:hypothetical protein
MNHKLITVFVLTALLSGCAMFTPKPPQIQYVTQIVKVPVPVKCIRPVITAPKTTFDQAKKDDLLYNNLALLGAENDSVIAYSLQLKAALDKCSTN